MTHYSQPPERLSRLRPGDSVDMPVRRTAKSAVTTTPCCSAGVRVLIDEIRYMERVALGVPYVFRRCGGCRWPYRVEFPDNDHARFVLRWP
jgi:hypothetical protein